MSAAAAPKAKKAAKPKVAAAHPPVASSWSEVKEGYVCSVTEYLKGSRSALLCKVRTCSPMLTHES